MLTTKIDDLFNIVDKQKLVSAHNISKELDIKQATVLKIARYLEQLGLVAIDYQSIGGPSIKFIKLPEHEFARLDEAELINTLKLYKSTLNIQSANDLIIGLYNYVLNRDSADKEIYLNVRKYYIDNFLNQIDEKIKDPLKTVETYKIGVGKVTAEINIITQELSPVPFYLLSLLRFSELTRMVIDKIKDEVISKITYRVVLKIHKKHAEVTKEYFDKIIDKMKEVFPDIEDEQLKIVCEYIVITSTGLGDIEFLLRDTNLEEVVVNNSEEPIWVYHKKYGWLETNIIIDDESTILHYATLAGMVVDKTLTSLSPLMDARLEDGDRVNATIYPITSNGNTITIRKFAEHPWTITDFLINKTIDYNMAAMVWTAIQYELSILIVGGTGSGKTSTLNAFSQFIPPNQRIISIEDTRELRLPKTLHWVPMETKLPNPEGKGEVTMLDLIVNSLRMRPDRIIVGEIRRKKEADVLFEAMHTGHSVYATLHANTVQEAMIRLTTDPIGISPSLLPAVNLVFVQNRNRRTNTRRTFQVAEIMANGEANLLYQYEPATDLLKKVKEPVRFYETMQLFAGLSKADVQDEIAEKVKILKYLVENKVNSIEEIGQIVSYYYINKNYLMKQLFSKKPKKAEEPKKAEK